MDIKHHVIVSTLLAIFLYPTYGIFVLLIFLGGVLIDVDHYLWYIVVKKSFSIKKAYKYMKDEYHGTRNMILIFHNIEFWISSLIISYFFPLLFPFVIGLASHVAMDLTIFFKYRKTHPNPIAYSLIRKYIFR